MKPQHLTPSPPHRSKRPPLGFSAASLPPDLAQFAEGLAVDVFTRAANHGLTFQRAFLAVYMTGANDALSSQDGIDGTS